MNGNGGVDGGANLAHKFAALGLCSYNNGPPNSNLIYSSNNNNNSSSSSSNNNNDNDGLVRVTKAVEAAEVTIRQQAEENAVLRTELQRKLQELENYKPDNSTGRRPSLIDHFDEHYEGPNRVHQVDSSVLGGGDGVGGTFLNHRSDATVQQDIRQKNEDQSIQARSESHLDSINIDGTVHALSGGQRTLDSAGLSPFSSPSTTPFSPSMHQLNSQFNLSGQGLMPMAEVDNSSLWKQDLFVKIREHEEEILQLQRHLGDYSIKEAQIRNEKYILEKRIAYMRMAFDQQQQDLVDAASKAISYRQDIIEENIRLTYALQATQEERSVFVSSVLPLLAEYCLQPPVADTQSIVGNLKVLFKHLQGKLNIMESKLKESHYQLTPWRTDVNTSNVPLQSPSHPSGLELTTTTADWDTRGQQNSGLGDGLAQSLEPDMVRYSPLASRNTASQDVHAPLSDSQRDLCSMLYTEATAKQVTVSDPFSSTEVEDLQVEGQQNGSEPNAHWVSTNSPYSTSVDDPTSSYSPYLPPVLEEPSSSYSEAGEDDPLPGVEDLQITGDAFPGKELGASGISINGTTSCNFEWVRHLDDGSINYIEGAKQPKYLVTADDIGTVLAIEVQPLDDRQRMGEIVTVFANGHRKITCDPTMQNSVEKTLHNGHASFRVSLWTRYLDIWEPATLAIKSDGYRIKGSGPNGVLVTEKFLPTTSVTISFGNATEFSVISSGGVERRLREENDAEDEDFSCSRDAIVLTLRLFIMKAAERKKGKRRNLNLFFKH